ncbi:MAG: hypothetical protein COA70_13000 [Planctomycetota bacterium]|nr:MAG: hypothetical protein COA70_13000 [Planctomycetota bacterium]
MRFTHTLPLVLALGLAACSGDSKDSTPTFTDPVAAMDQADAAAASGNASTAQAGYEYAAENGDTKLKGDALFALIDLGLKNSMEDDALAAFERLKSEMPDYLNGENMVKLADTAARNVLAGAAEEFVLYAMENFPEVKDQLVKASNAIETIKNSGPNVSQSELGYVGD